MKQITLEELNKYNSQLSNGFKFNVGMYQCYGDKQVHKRIDLIGKRQLEVSIYWQEVGLYARKVILHVSFVLWKQTEYCSDMYLNEDYCYYDIGEPETRKNYQKIVDATKDLTNEKCIKYAYDNMEKLIKKEAI